ncbi:TAXI family TRAP transporter solute-binding subunit [Dongia soli]|uniref:TAXI family TRAP transporter solute-binding subunit n=1 Tax=Dongia soli TaxID=600628 RepID=A0ABU5EAK4_9PROT|nr:TAXI family TRAP transporter solute-binding subunit [Dongia soli]MDY0882937.1 TAXI family TRAP transporter solute-binding subunit [Dongia soli]
MLQRVTKSLRSTWNRWGIRRIYGAAIILAGVTALGGLSLMDGLVSQVSAQDVTYFRIGTSRPGSHLFNIAAEIGNAISNPTGGADCAPTDACGVPGVVGMAQTTAGAIESLQQLREGGLDAAIVQADLVALAAQGKGPFKEAGPDPDLRAIATVGDVALQVIVPAASPIKTLADLKGKRVATNPAESDGAISISQIFTTLGLTSRRVKLLPMELSEAASQLAAGKVDAIAIVERPDLAEITSIAEHMPIRLIPVGAAEKAKIGTDRRDLLLAHLPAGTDATSGETDTFIVPVLFVVTTKTDNTVAHELARTLVVPQRDTKLTSNPAASKPDAHVESTVIPLHPGVEQLLGTTN